MFSNMKDFSEALLKIQNILGEIPVNSILTLKWEKKIENDSGGDNVEECEIELDQDEVDVLRILISKEIDNDEK